MAFRTERNVTYGAAVVALHLSDFTRVVTAAFVPIEHPARRATFGNVFQLLLGKELLLAG